MAQRKKNAKKSRARQQRRQKKLERNKGKTRRPPRGFAPDPFWDVEPTNHPIFDDE